MSADYGSWTNLLRHEGPGFLKWIDEERMLSRKFDAIARALKTLLRIEVATEEQALNIWRVVPAVWSNCDSPGTYGLLGASHAYAWLYLLDRYVRTWMALRLLVEENCAAMGKYGVNALDVGTGPGPSAFATHDFYSAMVEYSNLGNTDWRQPANLTCVELDSNTNSLRHHLAEILYEQGQRESEGTLAMCQALSDFGTVKPSEERGQVRRNLREAEETYFDPVRNEWTSDALYTPDQANDIAQNLHRYRLITFSNFLTNPNVVRCFKPNLTDILQDATPGTVLLVIGGQGQKYRKVHRRVERIATDAGFQQRISGGEVSYSEGDVGNRVHQEEKSFFEHLQDLAPHMHRQIQEVCEHRKVRKYLEEPNVHIPKSRVHAYRKI